MNTPVFILGLIATVFALFAFLPLSVAQLRRPFRIALCGALCACSLGATLLAYRAQVRESVSAAALVEGFRWVRLRDRIFILEKTTETPPDLAAFAQIAPDAGGYAGMSAPEIAKWRADRIASSKADLADARERHDALLREIRF